MILLSSLFAAQSPFHGTGVRPAKPFSGFLVSANDGGLKVIKSAAVDTHGNDFAAAQYLLERYGWIGLRFPVFGACPAITAKIHADFDIQVFRQKLSQASSSS